MTLYAELLNATKTRQEIAELAATAEARTGWYAFYIARLAPQMERIVEITKELDQIPMPSKARDLVRDLRQIARELSNVQKDM